MFAIKSAIFYRLGLMLCISTITACGSIMDSDKVNYKTQTEAPTAKSLDTTISAACADETHIATYSQAFHATE